MAAERSRSAQRGSQWRAISSLVGAALIAATGCGDSPPGQTFYQRNIEPILLQKCAGNTSGCHSTNASDPFQFAAGNLDVTSFDNVQKRRDLLAPFGAYAYPLLLIKSVPAGALRLFYDTRVTGIDPFRPLEVQHSGGAILDVNSDAYFTLQNWLENGATENGLKPATPPQASASACSHALPAGFDKAAFVNATTQNAFNSFRSAVQPILTRHGCTAGNCHGAPQSDFYITCGESDDEVAFNFSQAWSFLNTPVDDSQLLRVPLAASAGGRGHTGGDQFASTSDADYTAIRTWAAAVVDPTTGIGRLEFGKGDPVKQFFASYVQPVLLARGCSFQACHSPGATNDLKLRSGTQNFFSAVALQKNYELLRNEFMAIEFADARRGRAVAKGLISNGTDASGIVHRGGPVLEAEGRPADPTTCGTFNPINPGASTPYCIFQEWINRERAALGAQVTDTTAGPATIVYVQRPAGSADTDRLSFDTFRGTAELRAVTTTFGAGGSITPVDVGGSTQLGGACGLGATPDIQTPDVANDGDRVVFAGRADPASPLEVYLVKLSDATCTPVTPAQGNAPNGLKIHNFSPVFSPDGKWVVFASTRGKAGPTNSRKRFLPQSDLWRVAVNGTTVDQGSVQQITFLSNSEVTPHFMREGRITMTTEKVSDGFYQLSGRRINWDRTDYHPLLAQRATSLYASLTDLTQTKPSMGYAAATDIREGSDGNFLVILSDLNADGSPVLPGGAGALGVFNRSIGPFEQGRGDVGFLAALRVVDGGAATGRAGATASYRAPVSLPDGRIMVSYASSATTGNFDIFAIDPRTNVRTQLLTGGTGVRVDAVLALKYPARQLYENRRQLVFGGNTGSDAGHAVLHMPDAPMVFTLLTGNLRRGRPVDAFRTARFLAVYTEGLCPATGCSQTANGIFESRTMLGMAPLASDGSVRIQLPSQTGVVFELRDDKGASVVKMTEEHQLGPGEQISMGIVQPLFDAVCAGCHGSITGHETDVRVTPDALTGASASVSATASPMQIGP